MKTPKDKMPEKENRFKKLDLSEIVQHNFSEKHYFSEELPKKQIVIHHTVSPESVKGDVNWWLNDRLLATTVENHYLWSLQKGKHDLKISVSKNIFSGFGRL